MNKINSYNELIVWQKSLDMVTHIYKITESMPKSESYGLITQMNRASVSIPCNIAEGWGRESTKSYTMFLKISRGSIFELETLVQIGRKLNLISEEQSLSILSRTVEMQRMLNSLIKKIKSNPLNKK